MKLNFTIRKSVVIIFLFILSVNLAKVTAQPTIKLKPTKEQAALMNTLKKEHGLHSATLLHDDFTNTYYALLERKLSKYSTSYGVANMDGKIIIPIECTQIRLAKGSDSKTTLEWGDLYLKGYGVGDYVKYNKQIPYNCNKPYPSHFILTKWIDSKRHNAIATTDGVIIKDAITGLIERLHGYYFYTETEQYINYIKPHYHDNHETWEKLWHMHKPIKVNCSQPMGLLDQHGETLLEPICSFIHIDKTTCCYGIKNQDSNDSSWFRGGFELSNPTNSVPAIFFLVKFSDGEWSVQRTRSDSFEKYISERHTTDNMYRDKGEEYFETAKYNEVVEFYAKDGISAPWAKFYSGYALYHIGLRVTASASIDIKRYNNGDEHDRNNVVRDMQNEVYDFASAKKQMLLAIELLDAYNASGDTTFTDTANSTIKSVNNSLERLDDTANSYNALEERHYQQLAEIEHRRAQNAKMWGAILNAFGDALVNAASQPTKSSSSYSGSGSSSYSSSSSSGGSLSRSSSSSDAPKAQPDQAHINKLKKNIENAQEQYQKSIQRGDPAYQRNALKNSLDSYIKTLDTYMNSFK